MAHAATSTICQTILGGGGGHISEVVAGAGVGKPGEIFATIRFIKGPSENPPATGTTGRGMGGIYTSRGAVFRWDLTAFVAEMVVGATHHFIWGGG